MGALGLDKGETEEAGGLEKGESTSPLSAEHRIHCRTSVTICISLEVPVYPHPQTELFDGTG